MSDADVWRAFYRDVHGIVSAPVESEPGEVDPDDGDRWIVDLPTEDGAL